MATTQGLQVTEEPLTYHHDGARLVGYLATPTPLPADERRPAVLVFPEWWGVTDYPRRRAQQLAAQGYVAFAADMFGDGVTTDDPAQAARLSADARLGALSRARSRAALEVVRAHPQVHADRIAAIGFCFGGDVALELARSGAELRGAVAFHASLRTEDPARAEDLHAKVLVLHGADDPLVPAEQLQAFQDEMRAARADWQLASYGGAVHSFSNPSADEAGIDGVAYDGAAARRSWALHLEFLAEVLAPTTSP